MLWKESAWNEMLLTRAVLVSCLLVLPFRLMAQPNMSGAAAVQSIDWDSVRPGDPIPTRMPTSRADDAIDARFAPQWVERSIASLSRGTPAPLSRLVLAIISQPHASDDTWANRAEQQLSRIVRTEVATGEPTVFRLFCSSAGCLCYLQRDGKFLGDGIVFRELLGDAGRALGIKRTDLDKIRIGLGSPEHPPTISWELTVVRRPRGY